MKQQNQSLGLTLGGQGMAHSWFPLIANFIKAKLRKKVGKHLCPNRRKTGFIISKEKKKIIIIHQCGEDNRKSLSTVTLWSAPCLP